MAISNGSRRSTAISRPGPTTACTKRLVVAFRPAGRPSLVPSGASTGRPIHALATRSNGVRLLPYAATSSMRRTRVGTCSTCRFDGSPRRPRACPVVLEAFFIGRATVYAPCKDVAIRHVSTAAFTGTTTFPASCRGPSMASHVLTTSTYRGRVARTSWSPSLSGTSRLRSRAAAAISRVGTTTGKPAQITSNTECEGLTARLSELLQRDTLLHREQ